MIRPLPIRGCSGQPILNEYDCPILSITNLLYSHRVSHAVSVIHECTTHMYVCIINKRIEHVQLSFPSLVKQNVLMFIVLMY